MEYDSQGSLTKVLVRGSGYGGGIGSVIYTADDTNGTNRRFFLYNALGSTSAMANDAMTVTSTSSYDGWGKEVSSTGSSETDRKFCTKERSASIGLDYFGFRYYDYDLGRFTTRDPSGYPDGLNNYLYCSNDPVNKIDPLGLASLDDPEWHHYIQQDKKTRDFFAKKGLEGKAFDKFREKAGMGIILDVSDHRLGEEALHSNKWRDEFLEKLKSVVGDSKKITREHITTTVDSLKHNKFKVLKNGFTANMGYNAWGRKLKLDHFKKSVKTCLNLKNQELQLRHKKYYSKNS